MYIFQVASINDKTDYKTVMDAMKQIGFSFKHAETVWKTIAAILHLVSNLMLMAKCNIVCTEDAIDVIPNMISKLKFSLLLQA